MIDESRPAMARILVIRGGAIGDFILTIPAIQLIRSRLPQAHVEILGYPAVTALAKNAGIADAVRSIEYAGLANFFNPSTILDPDLMEYFAGFDLVVSFLYDPDGYFAGNLARSGVTSALACSHRIDEGGRHAAFQLAQPLEQIALFLEDPAPRLAFPEAILACAAAHATPALLEAGPIALHPGSGSARKNWPIEHWIALLRLLRARLPARPFVLVSGEADAETAGPLLAALEGEGAPHFHARHLDLSTLGALFSRCALFLGHDSGISHLAAAAGAPGLLLFGPTNPAIWAPQNPAVTVVQAPGGDLAALAPDAIANRAAGLLA